jgi:hypothetical protein
MFYHKLEENAETIKQIHRSKSHNWPSLQTINKPK